MDELKQKYIGKFFGTNVITDISITGDTTPLGSIIFELTFQSGKKQIVPEKSLVTCVTDKLDKGPDKNSPKDPLNLLYEKLFNSISDECVKVISEYDLPSFLFSRIGDKIGVELENHLQRASAILWFGDTEVYAPGYNSTNNITLLMADKINRKFPPKENVG